MGQGQATPQQPLLELVQLTTDAMAALLVDINECDSAFVHGQPSLTVPQISDLYQGGAPIPRPPTWAVSPRGERVRMYVWKSH